MFVIAQGKVIVSHGGMDIAMLGAGEHFGEISLLDAQPRSATVTSQEAGSVIIIRREALAEFTKRDPDLGGQVYARLATTLAKRLRQTNTLIADGQMPTITM